MKLSIKFDKLEGKFGLDDVKIENMNMDIEFEANESVDLLQIIADFKKSFVR